MPSWVDIETPVARALGPVDARVSGPYDSQ
jgi:hypothetical protein